MRECKKCLESNLLCRRAAPETPRWCQLIKSAAHGTPVLRVELIMTLSGVSRASAPVCLGWLLTSGDERAECLISNMMSVSVL